MKHAVSILSRPAHSIPTQWISNRQASPKRSIGLNIRASQSKADFDPSSFYVPLTLSHSIESNNRIKGEQIFGQKLAVFRDKDKNLVAMQDACPHLFASLSAGGAVRNNVVRCGYHGTGFRPDGSVVEDEYAKCKRIKTYPVVEKNGIVFAANPLSKYTQSSLSIPFEQEMSEPGFHQVFGEGLIASPARLVHENTIDIDHLPVVHLDSVMQSEIPKAIVIDAYTKQFTYGLSKTNPVRFFFRDSRSIVTVKRNPPFSAYINIQDQKSNISTRLFLMTVPVNQEQSKLIWCISRNFCTQPIIRQLVDPIVWLIGLITVEEDRRIVESIDYKKDHVLPANKDKEEALF